VIQDPSNPFHPVVENQLQSGYLNLFQKSHYSLKRPFWLELYVSSLNCADTGDEFYQAPRLLDREIG
jgi:hypothetical protein